LSKIFCFSPEIKEFCNSFLLPTVDPKNCISVWMCARLLNLDELLTLCQSIFFQNLAFVDEKELQRLSNDDLSEIMKGARLLVRFPLLALDYYGLSNPPTNWEVLCHSFLFHRRYMKLKSVLT